MTDAALAMRCGIAGVLFIAGSGKLIGRAPKTDKLIALVELLLASALALAMWPIATAATVFVLSVGFLIHAARPATTWCRCFGSRLPSTSILGQRIRNAALVC